MIKSVLSSLVTTLILLSCSGPVQHTQKTLKLNISSDPPSLDPRRPADTTSITVLSMCFDGLMRRDENGGITPSLAETYFISDDGKRYTFHLKKTFWSDGKPLTALDFENSFKMILSPSFPSEYAQDLYVIKNGKGAKEGVTTIDSIGVKALDDYTLSIELEYHLPYFIDMLASHSFYPIPSHKLNDSANESFKSAADYVCNGPFKIKVWKHHDMIQLEKNSLYHDIEKVMIEKIDLYIVESESTQLGMFDNKEIHWAGSPLSALPSDALCQLSKRDDFYSYPLCATYYYIFNTSAAPFNNSHIRKAFSYAINRHQIIDHILQGKQLTATSLIPPAMGEIFSSCFSDNDIEAAKNELQLGLKEMHIELQDLPAIKLSYNTNSAHHIIAQAIQEQWLKALGVKVELENMEWKVFLDHLYSGAFQIARMGGVASFNDPTTFLKDFQYAETRVNQSKWSDPEFSRLIDLSDQIQDASKRKEILRDAEEILLNDMPIAPIYFYTGSYLKKAELKGVSVSDLGEIDFKYARISGP